MEVVDRLRHTELTVANISAKFFINNIQLLYISWCQFVPYL